MRCGPVLASESEACAAYKNMEIAAYGDACDEMGVACHNPGDDERTSTLNHLSMMGSDGNRDGASESHLLRARG